MNEVAFISEEDAHRFLIFMQHYQNIALLIDSGVFDLKKCNISIDIDHDGVIRSIKRTDYLLSSRS